MVPAVNRASNQVTPITNPELLHKLPGRQQLVLIHQRRVLVHLHPPRNHQLAVLDNLVAVINLAVVDLLRQPAHRRCQIAIRNGAHFLVDFKTSNGPYCRFFPKADSPEVIDAGGTFGGWKKYQKCATQLAAYKRAIKETLDIDIHRVEILTSTPEITQRFQIHGPELKKFECRWLQKVRAYYDLVAEETAAAEAGLTLEEYRASQEATATTEERSLLLAC